MAIPEPWRGDITASVELMDHLEREIDQTNKRLKQRSLEPPLHSAADERSRGRLGVCVHDRRRARRDREVLVAGEADRLHRAVPARQPEATMHALKHPAYAERYQRTKRRLGKQRGAKVAQIAIARRLTHAIWHMLSRNEQFAPRGAAFRLAA